jgi:hypothetical protein
MTSVVDLRWSPDDDRRPLILRCDHPRESTNEHDSVNSCNLGHGQVKATNGSEGKLGHEGKGGEIIRLPPTSSDPVHLSKPIVRDQALQIFLDLQGTLC